MIVRSGRCWPRWDVGSQMPCPCLYLGSVSFTVQVGSWSKELTMIGRRDDVSAVSNLVRFFSYSLLLVWLLSATGNRAATSISASTTCRAT